MYLLCDRYPVIVVLERITLKHIDLGRIVISLVYIVLRRLNFSDCICYALDSMNSTYNILGIKLSNLELNLECFASLSSDNLSIA